MLLQDTMLDALLCSGPQHTLKLETSRVKKNQLLQDSQETLLSKEFCALFVRDGLKLVNDTYYFHLNAKIFTKRFLRGSRD